ncbi:MAG: DUF1552 domain-containing protein [Pseudomonadota bacterium]
MTNPSSKVRSTPTRLVSRRSFIRGLPASLAGLALVSPFWSRLIGRAMAQEAGRQRLIVWYTADGTVPEWFWPSSPGPLTIRSDRTNDLSGRDFNRELPSGDRPTFILQPLANYASQMLLVKGISNPGENDHAPCVQSCLTGEAVRSGNTGSSPSLDILMSEVHAKSNHAEPVLRTGVYGNRVSYKGTRDLSRPRGRNFVEPSWQPVSDARRVLDAVGGSVGSGEQGGSEPPDTTLKTASRLAVLGSVRERVEALRCAAGTPAATRLEAYVEEVARLERLEAEMRPAPTPGGGAATLPVLDPSKPDYASAQSDIAGLPKIAPLIRDMTVTALALDYAPAVTIQWGASGNNNIQNGKLTDYRYDFLLPELEYPGAGDHGLAHPEDGAFQNAGHRITVDVSTRDRIRIYRWFFGQLAELLDRLSGIPDGSGTLFDSTTVLCVSEFGGPNANSTAGQHSPKNLPYVLIAGKNTPFRTGEFLSVERNHGEYLLTLARGFGSTESSMGVGSRTIDGILKA